jgi:prepilin signal peptidase PulO-like enzyme (type II secretory pathway)
VQPAATTVDGLRLAVSSAVSIVTLTFAAYNAVAAWRGSKKGDNAAAWRATAVAVAVLLATPYAFTAGEGVTAAAWVGARVPFIPAAAWAAAYPLLQAVREGS